MTHYSTKSGEDKLNKNEWAALRLTAFVLLLAIAVVVVAVILLRTCSVDAAAKSQIDYEAVARLVELKDGVLSERRHYETELETVPEREHEVEEITDCGVQSGTEERESADDEEAVLDPVPMGDEAVSEKDCGGEETHPAETRTVAFVMGEGVIDPEILCELKARLTAYGIENWLPYAEATMFQESKANPVAENRNGLDKGLFQYRITYWSAVCVEHGFPADTSIFDWRVQIAIYVSDTARRLNSGLSIEQTISRHNTSDYGQYNPVYVNQVMQWVR